MPSIIPFDNSFASFSEEVTLDNVPYLLTFNYNIRFDFWTVSFKTRDETAIADGIKIVLNYELIRKYPELGLPPGALFAIDTTGKEERVSRYNLGDTVQLYYLSEDEVDAI